MAYETNAKQRADKAMESIARITKVLGAKIAAIRVPCDGCEAFCYKCDGITIVYEESQQPIPLLT